MKRVGLLWSVFLLGMLCSGVVAQQFRISEYDGDTVTIEYPPSFAGAYLFIEKNTNLVSGAWEVVDYSQVDLVEGAEVLYSPSVAGTNSASSTNQVDIPYQITPEFIMAVTSGEITNSEWIASSYSPAPSSEGDSASYRIAALSFVDTDGDGIDNVSEYGAGTDPYTNDAPVVTLPVDDGDPQPVPGSLDSAPGDWNTLPQNIYRVSSSSYEAINLRILAMDGTLGTFTAQTPVAILGAWVEAQCGTWQAVAGDDFYPRVSGGNFYRNSEESFSWTGKEHVFALALNAYNGSEAFVNHLVQATPSDPVGLALLSDGTPVLVDASNPWTEEKVKACLEQMRTVTCRVQQLSGDVFDPADTTAMAQAQTTKNGAALAPDDRLWQPNNVIKSDWEYDWYSYQWIFQSSSYAFTRNQHFTFLDGLQAHGFGSTTHRGYVGVMAEYDWKPDGGDYKRSSWQSTMPPGTLSDLMTETFVCADHESTWFMGGSTNYCDVQFREIGQPNMVGGRNYFLTHQTGFQTYEYAVLSTLDPPASFDQTLIMDTDRDGTIGTNDWSRIDESHPFRFWVNEDGNNATYPEADMEDFFPAQIMWAEDTPNLTFKLSANVALDYVPTSMTTNNTDAYLTELDVAGTLSGNIQSLGIGSQTPEAFVENSIVLLAASGVHTNAEIYVHILENGLETAVATNHFSFSSITNMYRVKNLRANGIDSTSEPSNWPDELTNGKDFVFIHGFNVDESAGRDWNKEIFKRLWHSGSNAKFHGILWDGTPDTTTWFDFGPYHYHNAVIHAFATAPSLASYLGSLNEPVVAAHSLGNMLVSEAVSGDHGLAAYTVKQYYALDAAVALEAYGDSGPVESMTADNRFDRMDAGILSGFIPFLSDLNEYDWVDYPFIAWASEWYRLFDSDDSRSEITWRHKFADIQDKTDVFNFYSSTEDVLRIDTNYVSLVSATSHQYSWQIQEHFKGRLNSNWITGIYDSLGGAASDYCGWGFVDQEPTEHIVSLGHLEFYPVRPRHLHEKVANENPDQAQELEQLKTDPLFRPKPAELFSAGAEDFAGGTVATHGGTLDYNISNATYPIDDVPIRDFLLAKAFPARTRPLGSTPVNPQVAAAWENVSFDMHSLYMTDTGSWLYEDDDENKEWQHSSLKNAPYVHVYKLFKKITTKEN